MAGPRREKKLKWERKVEEERGVEGWRVCVGVKRRKRDGGRREERE